MARNGGGDDVDEVERDMTLEERSATKDEVNITKARKEDCPQCSALKIIFSLASWAFHETPRSLARWR